MPADGAWGLPAPLVVITSITSCPKRWQRGKGRADTAWKAVRPLGRFPHQRRTGIGRQKNRADRGRKRLTAYAANGLITNRASELLTAPMPGSLFCYRRSVCRGEHLADLLHLPSDKLFGEFRVMARHIRIGVSQNLRQHVYRHSVLHGKAGERIIIRNMIFQSRIFHNYLFNTRRYELSNKHRTPTS